ncbi:hypothetical protein [Streptomyces litchfieldiae]|uniref:Uncharacterized protein n=1 Tax=Streptomyces litchfieldiae TaxID=3075543 RepID=A0ABU2MLK8_9ACTN|nr:hypothetical protein [Streptomyces sp. DSM 44938]MDT0342312.1 hypothetical protein [Streptomyces sp. DSM 44938]
MRPSYQVHFTEQAAAKRDSLEGERRAAFDKAVDLLSRDPYSELTRAISATGDDREVRLTQHIMIEYTVSTGRLLIFIIEIFDDQDIFFTG